MIGGNSGTGGKWSSRFGFILAATGAAVGLGNIWKFPYITGENGGGAFVLVYLICVLLIGIPLMIAELSLGRRGGKSPVNTLLDLARESMAPQWWWMVGMMGVLAGFLILSYYSVVAGWTLVYSIKMVTGGFWGLNASEISNVYDQLISDPVQLLFWHTVFTGGTMWLVAQGVQDGLERAVRFMMPALFGLLILLVIYSLLVGDASQAMNFLFSMDFDKLSGDSVLVALGQAFFSIGLGMGMLIMYGAYLPEDVNIAESSFIIAAADTAVALLAGLAIFPIVFANQLEPGSGAGLIFQTLPIAFSHMPLGSIFGFLFFLLLVFAALSSSIALIEPAVSWLMESRQLSRADAALYSGVAVWLTGLLTVFSFNEWASVQIFGMNLFELIDYLTSNIFLPLGGVLIAVFTGWVVSQSLLLEQARMNSLVFKIWINLVKYLVPAGIFLVLLSAIGVF
ncbi:MAG: sodium-dependent transporter [Gammaproteobacteria bacterium]|nr:sodium-dependent transporter [Gammaproteobacteria bacterium]